MTIFYKDDFHKEETFYLLNKLGKSSIEEDLYYGAFAYIVGATGKVFYIKKAVSDHDIDVEMIYEMIDVFSSSEISMIRFALQCFNSSIDDIKITDVMKSLDSENAKVIKQAIDLLF